MTIAVNRYVKQLYNKIRSLNLSVITCWQNDFFDP